MPKPFACVLVGLLLAGCASSAPFPRDPGRHTESGISLTLWRDAGGGDKPFTRYVADTRQALQSYRWTIAGEPEALRNERIERTLPREWAPAARCAGARAGVLLVHGLTDSPYLMLDVGDALATMPERCLLIRSILLPGHASRPGDLLDVEVAQWKEAVRHGLRSFAGQVPEVHVVGFSTGAALAVREALERQPAGPGLRSLVLLSPAIRPQGIVSRLYVLPRLVALLSRLSPAWQWLDVLEDRDWAKYESFALNAAIQLLRLDDEMKFTATDPLPVPVFMALSADDHTVNADDAIRFFQARTGASSRLVLYVRRAARPAYEARHGADTRITLVDADDSARGIRSMAHTSIPGRPENPHYGARGDYTNCLHYVGAHDPRRYCRCLPARERPASCPAEPETPARYGETLKGDVDDHDVMLRRLTYNPWFPELMRAITRFLDATGRP